MPRSSEIDEMQAILAAHISAPFMARLAEELVDNDSSSSSSSTSDSADAEIQQVLLTAMQELEKMRDTSSSVPSAVSTGFSRQLKEEFEALYDGCWHCAAPKIHACHVLGHHKRIVRDVPY